jgi:hypothetical protein
MQRVQRILVMTAALVAGVTPVLALTEPTIEEREENRRLLEQWQSDPDHMARLQQNLATFRALPPEKQDRLRQLDRALAREDKAARARLLTALERYKVWLGQLPEAERNEILAAPNAKERLQLVRRIRTREWIARLPAADKKKLKKAPDQAARLALIRQLRQDDHERRAEWQIARRFWQELMEAKPMPARLEDLLPATRDYVGQSLVRLLNDEEKKRLDGARGQWPRYPRTLVELADQHPVPIPGPVGPTRLEDIPKKMVKINAQGALVLQKLEGQWPEFGSALRSEIVRHHKKDAPKILEKIPPGNWTPARLEDFAQPVQQFITQELIPVLDQEDRDQLDKAPKTWPSYPKTIAVLARRYHLQIPGTRLPDREYWDRYRPQSLFQGTPASGPIPSRRDWLINRLPE